MTIFADIWGFLSLLVDHWRAFLIAGTLSGLGLISMILQARRHPILATVIGMTLLAIATVDLSGPTPDPAPTASAEMKATDPEPKEGIIHRGLVATGRAMDWAREVIDG
jgi:hypothetical protein